MIKVMKQNFLKVAVISIGLLAGLNGNATVIDGGSVSGKWTKADSPYQVNGDITVAAGTTLEIEPGVTVAFGGNVGLTINGQLLAEGTKDDNIVCTRQSTNNWMGLIFSAAGENESIVKYASIEYSNGSGVRITGGTVVLSNNTISNNTATYSRSYNGWVVDARYEGGGIYISGGTATLSNNTISNNTAWSYGGGVYIVNGATAIMNNNTISNNIASDSLGGGIYMENSTVNMYNNIISGNSATQAGGGVYVSNMIANIHNNVISNNKHAASKSGNGGGISLFNSNSMIINNTIAYNDAENGGGLYCSSGSSPVVINNIIYGNTSSVGEQVFVNDNNSAPKMLYNLNQCDCLGITVGVN